MATYKQYVIVGGGGFGREVACWLLDLPEIQAGHIAGFLDDEVKEGALFPPGIAYLGSIAAYQPREGHELLLGIGGTRAKRDVVSALRAKGARFATLRHPTAVVAATARIGEGVILCPYAVVSANGVVGDFVTVNIASTVGHDVRIGAWTTLSAHVDLTGGVSVGESVNLGSGARVLPGLRVGNEATVGAGAVVMRNVEAGSTVYAAAAKRL